MDAPNQIIDVDNSNFESEIIASKLPVLVDFWGPMCGPCKTLEPFLVQLASQHSHRIPSSGGNGSVITSGENRER